jgi:hypothetical protein
MKKISFVVIAFVAILFASCGTERTISYTTSIGANNYIVDVTPLVATLQVTETHITGEFEITCKKRAIVNYDELRDNAIFNALKKSNSDVLVAPQYQIKTSLHGGKKSVQVTVVGYPAKYVNFMPAPKAEKLEIQELKDNANYVLINKDTQGKVCGYRVVLPYDKNMKTLDLEDATVDKVVLDGAKVKLGEKKIYKEKESGFQVKNLIKSAKKK